MIKEEVLWQDIEEIYPWLVDIRRDFHQYPEISTKEIRTQQKIISYLKEMDINYRTFQSHYGVEGTITAPNPKKTIALRADMDALPMTDEKTVGYASKNMGAMHSCGHDAHMAILLGAGRILKKYQSSLNGNVKLIFQPAEETIGGAKPMIKDGVLENPKVDAIFGLHVSSEIPVGKIAVRYGQMNANSDSIEIIVEGKSSHGAYPHGGYDGIVIAGHIITAIQTISARNIDPRDSCVITIGVINGGTQANIMAERITMKGTVRTINQNTRERVFNRLRDIVENTSMALGGKGHLYREEGYIALLNDNHMVQLVEEQGIRLLGKENVIRISNVSLGVEDFAYFTNVVQGAFYVLGAANHEKEIVHCGHTTKFDIDEECLKIGVMMQLMNTLAALEEKSQ